MVVTSICGEGNSQLLVRNAEATYALFVPYTTSQPLHRAADAPDGHIEFSVNLAEPPEAELYRGTRLDAGSICDDPSGEATVEGAWVAAAGFLRVKYTAYRSLEDAQTYVAAAGELGAVRFEPVEGVAREHGALLSPVVPIQRSELQPVR